jgi:hypothetical protein
MGLKIIQVTDNKSGAKMMVNIDNVCYFLDMGHGTLIDFGRNKIVVRETYEHVQHMITNI